MHASCNTCRWKNPWNSASPRRITAVPCTQMQASVPAKKRKDAVHLDSVLWHKEWQNKTTFHGEMNYSVTLLPALPSALVSVFWIGFVLLCTKTSLGWIDEESGLSMEETEAPLLFQQGLSSISPSNRKKRFVRVVTEEARGVSTAEIQRLSAWKGRCVPAAVTAGQEMLSVLRMRAGGGGWLYP